MYINTIEKGCLERASLNELRYVTIDRDKPDERYNWWSRIYEYSAVMDAIKNSPTFLRPRCVPFKVHNTGWGWEGDHVIFRNDLDDMFGADNVVHSDIITDQFLKTTYHDITVQDKKYEARFDIVLCVSILEHLKEEERTDAINNLYSQLVPGGTLIISFDVQYYEHWIWLYDIPIVRKHSDDMEANPIGIVGTPLTQYNGIKNHYKYHNLNVAILSITKDELYGR